MSRLPFAVGIMLVLVLSPPAHGQVIAITGGKILPITSPPIEAGTVLIEKGKIAAVGKMVAVPPGATVIDATGKLVLPGMIDAHTYLGLWEVDLVPVTRDEDEPTDPILPQLRVIDALFPASEVLPVTRVNGITAALSAPGEGNVIAGQSALIRLAGETLEQLAIKFPVGMHVNLGEPPKSRYGERHQLPSTRMGIAAILRKALVDAQIYDKKWTEYTRKQREYQEKKTKKEEPTPPERDLKLEALLPVLRGELPVIARAHRLDDILTALRIAEEFKLRLILNHGTEAYKIADRLARAGIPVLVGPVTTQPDAVETQGAIYQNAARLARAGVKIALQTNDVHNVRNLPYMAGLAVAYGLPYEEALKAVTIHPAEIFGVADRLGSLEVGKDADLVVWDGDPFQPRSHVTHLFIQGQALPLTNRQTELYDRYRKKE